MKTALYLVASLALVAGVFAQDGEIKVTATLHPDGGKTITRTDMDARQSVAETYDAGNKLTQKIVYSIGENGQADKGIVYAPNGTALMKSEYRRDQSGRVREEINYAMDGSLIRRFVYEFDARGKVAKIRAFDANGNELQPAGTSGRGVKDKKKRPPRVRR